MKLSELVNSIEFILIQGDINVNIEQITYDSRQVKESSCFICVSGKKNDGHDYIDNAINNGAIAILYDKPEKLVKLHENVNYIKVDNVTDVLSTVSNEFYNIKSHDINYIGITGTNGKTSTANMISHILNKNDRIAGTIGTLANRVRDNIINIPKTNPTTPNCIELAETIASMIKLDADYIVMEVSSMALELKRVQNIYYKVAVFTNLTQDHLDDHHTMENYKNAKMKLFNLCDIAVLNNDDAVSEEIKNISGLEFYTYAVDGEADFKAVNLYLQNGKMIFDVIYKDIKYPAIINFPGKFSVYNALVSIEACFILGVDITDSINALKSLAGIPGRFETIYCRNGVTAIIDYAHTPDALLNILRAVREFAKQKMILIFGCGGDRDRSKRAIMGDIADNYSDYFVITSDNPRTEEPKSIIEQIEAGIKTKNNKYEKIIDRKEAILKTLTNSCIGDIVIIAGKGDEDYQEINNIKTHYSDRETVEEFNLTYHC